MNNVSTIRLLQVKLTKLINSLPDDIKMYIYKEFLETEIKYRIINTFFKTKCNDLSNKSSSILQRYVFIILHNKKLKDMFLQKSKSFKMVYEIKKEKKQLFDLITNPYKDFALGWMFTEYH
jgi:hypothetical protein